MSIACAIKECYSDYKVYVYNVKTKDESEDSISKEKPIQEIVDELFTKYGNDIGKIVVDEGVLKPDKLEDFKKENSKKHGDLVYVATKEDLDFEHYLTKYVEYLVEDLRACL